MILLILALILATIALAVLAFGFSSTPDKKIKKQKEFKPRQDTRESVIPSLEDEINSLKIELEKAKTDYQNIQRELESTRKKESDLKGELEKIKTWDNKEHTELEKVKKENSQLREELINKEKEAEKEFAINLNLNKELKENKERLALLEKEKRDMVDEIRKLNAQIAGLQKELDRQNKVIWEMKKKEEESAWISKREYAALKKQLEEKEEILKRLQQGSQG